MVAEEDAQHPFARHRATSPAGRVGNVVAAGLVLFVLSGVFWAWGYGAHPVLEEEMRQAFLAALPLALALWGYGAVRLRRALRERAIRIEGCIMYFFAINCGVMSFALLAMGLTGVLLVINGVFAGGERIHTVLVHEKDSHEHSHSGDNLTVNRTSTVYVAEVDDWVGRYETRSLSSSRDYFDLELWNAVDPGGRLRLRVRPGLLGWTTVVAVEVVDDGP